ncbi:Capsular glucan synthase [Serratia fonticola]|uniref:Capsular glucan synthase n=1 Tax=Serratia fonticola TaxID=47917 RepID=A0A3S4WJV9_SERFO|nr:Capsular glucan synthase [Serratia fonticola]
MKAIKVIINVSKLGKEGTGMWNYTKSFIHSVHEIGHVNGVICPKHHAEFFHRYTDSIIQIPDCVSSTSKVSKVKPILFMVYNFLIAFKIKSEKSIIISTTHHAIPFIKNQVITIHDLRPLFYPDSFLQKVYFKYILPRTARNCLAVYTVSNSVKKQLIENYNIEPENIHVIYNSIKEDDFLKSDSSGSKSILAVGCNWKHKNIHSFINNSDVWKHKYKLRIICAKTSYYEELITFVNENKLNDCVTFIHNLSFNELKQELSNAWCLVYPSIDEGFGIPPIEAMASSTPVIASDIPVFREILGKSAVYVQPDDALSWKNAIEHLESEREKYVELGLLTAQKYSESGMQEMIRNSLTKFFS